MKNESLGNLEEKEYFGMVGVRVLVHEWPKASGSSLQLLIVQEEVVELDGRQVGCALGNWGLEGFKPVLGNMFSEPM